MTGIPDRDRIAEWLSRSPFVAFMGLRLETPGPEDLTLAIDFRPEFGRSADGEPRWHGGVVAALIDTAGDFALIALSDFAPPTINFRVDYLRPVTGDSLRAVTRVRKAGRQIGFVDVEVLDPGGNLVAVGRANYATAASSRSKERAAR